MIELALLNLFGVWECVGLLQKVKASGAFFMFYHYYTLQPVQPLVVLDDTYEPLSIS
jgi:hypothetical protein